MHGIPQIDLELYLQIQVVEQEIYDPAEVNEYDESLENENSNNAITIITESCLLP
ncbi:8750_t:CDS:1, partial [Gigaspora rosea]